MIEIPLSSAIVQDQPNSDTNSAQSDNDSSQPQLIGTGPLRSANKLCIKQRIRAGDVFSLITGCEVEKKFNIHGSAGEVLYSAKEKSNFCCRCCCGNIRTLDINIRDPTGKDIIHFSRPINCAGLCCGILYPFCTQALSVSVNGESAGVVRERATWCYPVFHIYDSVGEAILKVRGPLFHFGNCGENVPFEVTSIENGGHVATITKMWGGCCRDSVLDAGNFVIDFYLNMSIEEKALVLATAFLIDLMYFENSG